MGMIIFTSQFSFSSHDGITYVWVKTTILLCFNLQLNGKKQIFFVCQTTTFSLLTLHWAFPFPPATPNTLWHTHPFQHTHQETFSKKKKRRTKQSNKNKWNVCVLKVMPKRSPEPCALAETPVTWRNGNRIIHFSNAHTLTDAEYWSTEQQLGICYKWWNRNVLRHPEIGFFFFSDTLTSCSWEDWTLILTRLQQESQAAVVKGDLQLAGILALGRWKLSQLLE